MRGDAIEHGPKRRVAGAAERGKLADFAGQQLKALVLDLPVVEEGLEAAGTATEHGT